MNLGYWGRTPREVAAAKTAAKERMRRSPPPAGGMRESRERRDKGSAK